MPRRTWLVAVSLAAAACGGAERGTTGTTDPAMISDESAPAELEQPPPEQPAHEPVEPDETVLVNDIEGGTGDIMSGFDEEAIYGELLDDEGGETVGGFGPGGDGAGWGTIGSGADKGGGTGEATQKTPTLRLGPATVTGNLDENIVRRYLRRKLPRIRYCYEKAVLVDASLGGTVAVQFTVEADGTVTGATASGVSAGVSSCVAEVIEAIEFPAPTSGTVSVRQPFVFSME